MHCLPENISLQLSINSKYFHFLLILFRILLWIHYNSLDTKTVVAFVKSNDHEKARFPQSSKFGTCPTKVNESTVFYFMNKRKWLVNEIQRKHTPIVWI